MKVFGKQKLTALVLAISLWTACAEVDSSTEKPIQINQPSQTPGKKIMSNNKPEQPFARDVTVSCQIQMADNKLQLKYSVQNQSENDIYLLDAYPAVNPESREAFADVDSFYLALREPATAFLLKGIPPLPANRTVTVRVMPLGTKMEPKQKIERKLEITIPLKEQSKWYYAPLKPEEYEETRVDKIVFNAHFLRSTVEGFEAEPAEYAPGFSVVSGRHTVGQAEKVQCNVNLEEPLKLLKRKDWFTRI